MLQMLANILANLDVQLAEGGGEGAQEEQMQQGMDELSETMGEQRALNDETRQQDQSGQGGGGEQQGGQGGAELVERQSQIRQGLAEAQRMAEEAGAAPSEELNAAGDAMRQAENALRRGDLEGAQAAQSTALENLREGAQTLGAEMRERGREGGAQQGQSSGRDPLGREMSGAGTGSGEANVPTQSDPVRARQIFDDIRQRAQDPNRPEAEREYLRRLLDRFGDS